MDDTTVHEEFDFGFSTHDEYDQTLILAQNLDKLEIALFENEQLQARLYRAEGLIKPLLDKLLTTAEQPIIKWPNREKVIRQKLDDLYRIVHGDGHTNESTDRIS